MLEEIIGLFETPLEPWEVAIRIGLALLASIFTYVLYQFFYSSKHIGAGVHRTFLIAGPAITMIFLVIQSSIPLGFGLLGVLAFIRFRTPIKDPAEIGFLLLLIASSIGAATSNYLVTIILFVLVFIVLGVQWLVRNKFNLFGRGNLIISLDQASFPELESRLTLFLKTRLGGLRLDTMSVLEDRVSLNYQYRRKSDFNWPAFTSELNEMTGESKVEIFIG